MKKIMASRADQPIRNLPLKEMDATLLSRAILLYADDAGLDVDMFERALAYASYLHRNQTRQNRGHMPTVHYIEHPLRNTARLFRWGVNDQDVLIASILHDTVEDCADEIRQLAGVTRTSKLRNTALHFWGKEFGPSVMHLIDKVSNPDMPAGATKAEKHVLYRAHVIEVIQDPWVALVKFADFVDNALSLHHTDNPGMVKSLASKYAPLAAEFDARFAKPDMTILFGGPAVQKMREALNAGRDRLAAQAS